MISGSVAFPTKRVRQTHDKTAAPTDIGAMSRENKARERVETERDDRVWPGR